MDVRDKVVLITGASEGIGLATARRFAEAGAKLALVARSAAKLEKLAQELCERGTEAIAIPADLTVPEQVEHAIAEAERHFGRIDILINNAGQSAVGPLASVSLEHFRRIVDLNVFGPFVVMQAAIPIMREQGGGMIVNISSMVSKMRLPGLSAYAATKAALNMLSDTARVELASDNTRVISVFPRMTATDFHKHSLGSREMHGRTHDRTRVSPSVPIDSPEHVAERILAAAIGEVDEQYMEG